MSCRRKRLTSVLCLGYSDLEGFRPLHQLTGRSGARKPQDGLSEPQPQGAGSGVSRGDWGAITYSSCGLAGGAPAEVQALVRMWKFCVTDLPTGIQDCSWGPDLLIPPPLPGSRLGSPGAIAAPSKDQPSPILIIRVFLPDCFSSRHSLPLTALRELNSLPNCCGRKAVGDRNNCLSPPYATLTEAQRKIRRNRRFRSGRWETLFSTVRPPLNMVKRRAERSKDRRCLSWPTTAETQSRVSRCQATEEKSHLHPFSALFI